MWEAQKEFLISSFCLASPSCCEHLENEPVARKVFVICLSRKQKVKLKKEKILWSTLKIHSRARLINCEPGLCNRKKVLSMVMVNSEAKIVGHISVFFFSTLGRKNTRVGILWTMLLIMIINIFK